MALLFFYKTRQEVVMFPDPQAFDDDSRGRSFFDKGSGRPLHEIRPEAPAQAAVPTLGCVLMASGLSRRFGGNKLLASFHGSPLICRILSATDTRLFTRRIVVTRQEEVARLCEEMGIRTVLHSLPYRSDTVRLGLEAFGEDLPDGCMFCTCDQPLLSHSTIEKMALAFMAQPDCILRLAYEGVPGNPLIFPQKYFPALRNLPQGKGGAFLAASFPKQVRFLEAASSWELRDIDTKEELALLDQQDQRI